LGFVLISIVIPVYFNEKNLPDTWKALSSALAMLPREHEHEVVFVDDGSRDGSYAELLALYEKHPRHVRIVKLARNFGQPAAIQAGLAHARGDCAIVMSADLQDPPELISHLVERWAGGEHPVVLATRERREDGLLATVASRIFYTLMRRYAIPNMPLGGFDFFLVDRQVIDFINKVDEKNTFIQGLVLWSGYDPVIIPYTRRKREIGRSRWTLSAKLKYFIDGLVTYTVAPIRMISTIGLVVSLLSFGYASLIFVLKIFWDLPIEGWAPIMISVLMLAGVQMLMLGTIGEYLWRNYHQVRNLPNFVVERIDEEADDGHAPLTPGSDGSKDGRGR
jgi:glycosyltransferase involved in cell wall biosynthesis